MEFDSNRIDRITKVVHDLLTGNIPQRLSVQDEPHDEVRQLSEKVNVLIQHFNEIRDFIVPLSQGRLDIYLPRKNFLASPFKQLQASLNHLTWQAQQIAQGDYNQRVDFLGDFSIAFNSMVGSLREARSQLLAEIERYKSLAELKNHYLNVMAHDIRTPIGAIIGFADIILEGHLSDDQRRHVQIVKRNGESLLGLINNILDMAKLENRKMEIESIPFSIKTLTSDIKDMIRSKLNPGVMLRVDLDPDIPENLVGDPMRLQQILINLVGNAVKFTKQGSVKLSIERLSQEDDTLNLRFSVEDTGIGIPQDKLASIFTPFSQADGSIAHNFGGTGLGLAIANELVNLMNGKIEVKSILGQGTTFYFSIRQKIYWHEEKTEVLSIGKSRILVVDDDSQSLSIVSRMLEKQQVRFTLCQDSTQVKDLLLQALDAKDPFSLVWIDIEMPKLNGFELARIIREDRRLNNLRLIACSADPNRISGSDSPSHFSFVITKPITPRALQRVLQEAISANIVQSPEECDFSGCKLLIVDDNPMNRFLVKNIVQKFKIEISEAENGAEGIKKISENKYDIVLLDKMMPVMDGIEALKHIRKLYGKEALPVFMFTADSSPEDEKEALAAGANDIVSKPINYAQLMEKFCMVFTAGTK